MENAKLAGICPVFLSDDVRQTARYYVETLGFRCAEHYDKAENFATVYRDAVEIVIIQKPRGRLEPNQERCDCGDDAYIVAASLDAVDELCREFKARGVAIAEEPHLTDYGSREFAFLDCDGRRIGVGLIQDRELYFKYSNVRNGR